MCQLPYHSAPLATREESGNKMATDFNNGNDISFHQPSTINHPPSTLSKYPPLPEKNRGGRSLGKKPKPGQTNDGPQERLHYKGSIDRRAHSRGGVLLYTRLGVLIGQCREPGALQKLVETHTSIMAGGLLSPHPLLRRRRR